MDRCETCDTVGVQGSRGWAARATTDALIERVRSGRMREARYDVPLTDMIPLTESDLKYTIVNFLECLDCERILFWGLCIRGLPVLRHQDREAMDHYPFEPVPPREQWAPHGQAG